MTNKMLAIVAAGLLGLAGAGCSETPTGPTAAASPVIDTFASSIVKGGAASRTFTTLSHGTVEVTLVATTPEGTPLGVGIGIPGNAVGNRCSMAQAEPTVASTEPQLTLAVEAGTFCVQVYDVGAVERELWFEVTIEHP
jgi:hypothetical protein